MGSYDGILGIDWLAAHSPMQVDWAAHLLSFELDNTTVTLLGEDVVPPLCALLYFAFFCVHCYKKRIR